MSERNPKVTARNDGLQVARAVGCLSVLVGHAAYMAGIISGSELPTWIPRIFSPFGVYLFFVLSGYVMGLVFRSERQPDATSFLAHRALRIYPPYWAAAALYCAATYWLSQPVPPFDVLALLLSPAPLILYASTYGVPAWTLSYEMMFYLLVGAAIAARLSVRQALSGAALWVLIILGTTYAIGQPYSHVLAGFYLPVSAINLFFIAGFVAALCDFKLARVPILWLFAISATLLFAADRLLEPVAERLAPTLVQAPACVLMVLAFARLTPGSRSPLVSIGNASYGIYLVHLIVIETVFMLTRPHPLPVSPWLACIALTAVGLAFGWIFGLAEFSIYQVIVSRWHGWRNRRTNSQPVDRPA
jgi:exopolysaccharide production protein ExoZ